MTAFPAGWIPPEFREFVLRELTDLELETVRDIYWMSDGKGHTVLESNSEIRKQIKVVVGVKDTRTNEVHTSQTKSFLFLGHGG